MTLCRAETYPEHVSAVQELLKVVLIQFDGGIKQRCNHGLQCVSVNFSQLHRHLGHGKGRIRQL